MKANRFLWNLIGKSWCERFEDDPELLMMESGLNDLERRFVRDRDWMGLIRHGANFLVLEKFARVCRKTNLEVYAAMRGESFEEFMRTRRVPDAR